MNYNDEPVLGEQQARVKLNMIKEEKELANYIRNLLDRFPIEDIKQAQKDSTVRDESIKIEVPELKISDIVIIEDFYTGIHEEFIKSVNTRAKIAYANDFEIKYHDGHYTVLFDNELFDDEPDNGYRLIEVYRRTNEDTFKRIWKAE